MLKYNTSKGSFLFFYGERLSAWPPPISLHTNNIITGNLQSSTFGILWVFPLGAQLTLEMIPMSSTQCGVQSSGITFGIDIGRRPELPQLVLNQQGVFKILSQS